MNRDAAIEAGQAEILTNWSMWVTSPRSARNMAAAVLDAATPFIQAQAIRDAQEAWGGNWGREGRDVMFNVSGGDLTPQGRVGKWLESRADRIERGELR